MKDNRKTFSFHRLKTEKNSWNIDGKFNPENGLLKIYRVFGDITSNAYQEAIKAFALELGAARVLVFGRNL
jgi:hypothetical protein